MTSKNHPTLALLFLSLLIIAPLTHTHAVHAQELEQPLYDQLGERLTVAEDSAAATQELRDFLSGLSDPQLVELAGQAIDANDRLLLDRGVSRELRNRLRGGTAVDALLDTATEETEPPAIRNFAFGTLKSARREVTPETRNRIFRDAADVAMAAAAPKETRAIALETASLSLALLMEEGAAESQATETYGDQLETIILDRREDALLRVHAVRGVGLTARRTAVPTLMSLLSEDTAPMENPQVVRVTCNVLADFEEQSAITPISRILATTDDQLVFGSAAYSLGRLGTSQSLSSLLEAEDRFVDSGSIGVALRSQKGLIMETLSDPESPHLHRAIMATKYLYEDADVQEYRAKLKALLGRVSDPAVIRTILLRLREGAGRDECAAILSTIPRHPAYGVAWDGIYRCSISVQLMSPPSTIPTTD